MNSNLWGVYMSTVRLPAVQSEITHKSEVYNRESNGQLSPRVGFISDFLNSLLPQTQTNVLIQVNQFSIDLSAITTKLDALPVELNKRDLSTAYNAINKCLENYLTYKSPDILKDLFKSCQENSPKFEQCIKEQSVILNPGQGSFKNSLKEFGVICEAYAMVLGIYLFSAKQLYGKLVANETAIKRHLDEICQILHDLIRRTLLSNEGDISKSLLVKSLLNIENNRFDEYFLYSGYPNTPDGVKRLLMKANGEKPYYRGIHIEPTSSSPYSFGIDMDHDAMLADRAIELLKYFNFVYQERFKFKYEADTEIQSVAS